MWEVEISNLYIVQNSVANYTEISDNTGCSKSLGNILTLNMSKIIKETTMHQIYSKSLQSQIFHRMFKDVQCEHR